MTKRIISLLMAIALVISVFAIQAAATSPDDGIEPHTEWTTCNCGATVPISTYTKNVETYKACKYDGAMHRHDIRYRCTGYTCGSCGTSVEMSRTVINDVCSKHPA